MKMNAIGRPTETSATTSSTDTSTVMFDNISTMKIPIKQDRNVASGTSNPIIANIAVDQNTMLRDPSASDDSAPMSEMM